MNRKFIVATVAIALAVGLLVSPADARLTADGSTSYAFQSIDSAGLTLVLMSAGNADGAANNQEDGCDEQQVPDGEEKTTPSGVCYDPIDIGGSGT
ncbi:MAG: hypothetical protein ABEK03_01190 [Candidatus Bipolaricaulia bacterium]